MKPNTMPSVRLRATISIDIDAQDYLEAAEHQKKLEAYLSSVRSNYPGAWIAVIERRRPPAEGPARARTLRVHTGKLNVYE